MKEEVYWLYKSDPDFKDYVDKYCQKHHLGIFEALDIKIVDSYGEYIKKKGRMKDETLA